VGKSPSTHPIPSHPIPSHPIPSHPQISFSAAGKAGSDRSAASLEAAASHPEAAPRVSPEMQGFQVRGMLRGTSINDKSCDFGVFPYIIFRQDQVAS